MALKARQFSVGRLYNTGYETAVFVRSEGYRLTAVPHLYLLSLTQLHAIAEVAVGPIGPHKGHRVGIPLQLLVIFLS